VKQGDCLSKISEQEMGRPIYGSHGTLDQLLKVNPGISDPDFIQVGQVIEIPLLRVASLVREKASPLAPSKADETTESFDLAERVDPFFRQHSVLEFKPSFSFLRISGTASDTTNRTATLISDLNYGGDVSWKQIWSQKFYSFLSLGFLEVRMSQLSDQTISNANQLYSNMNVGGVYQLSPTFSVGGNLGVRSQVFYHASSNTDLSLDKVSIPHVGVWGQWEFYRLGQFNLGAIFQGELLLPSRVHDSTVHTGYSYLGSLYVNQPLFEQGARLQGNLFYGQSFQSTPVTNFSTSEVGLSLGFSWTFGNGS
jgi:hypothetical protein